MRFLTTLALMQRAQSGLIRPMPSLLQSKGTLSRTNTPEKNATILLNHYSDIQSLAKEQQSLK